MGHESSSKLKEIDGLFDYSSFDGKNDQLDVFFFLSALSLFAVTQALLSFQIYLARLLQLQI